MSDFTVGTVSLLSTLKAEALTWQPFIQSGLSINDWNANMERIYNLTQTS